MTKYIVRLTHIVTHDWSGGARVPASPEISRQAVRFSMYSNCAYVLVDESDASIFDSMSEAIAKALSYNFGPRDFKVDLIDDAKVPALRSFGSKDGPLCPDQLAIA